MKKLQKSKKTQNDDDQIVQQNNDFQIELEDNEDNNEQQTYESFKLELNRKFINSLIDGLRDAKNIEEVSKVVLYSLTQILMQHKLSSTQFSKDFVKEISQSVKDKIDDLSSETQVTKDKDDQILQNDLLKAKAEAMKSLLDHIFDGLYSKFEELNILQLDSISAKVILKFLMKLVNGFEKSFEGMNFTQNLEKIALILVTFLQQPSSKESDSNVSDKLVFSWLYGKQGLVKNANYKYFLREDVPLGRFIFLAKCLEFNQDEEVNQLIIKNLTENLEKLVLNDALKKPLPENNLIYFQQFLKKAQSQIVEDKILPMVQFIMNRSRKFIGLCAQLISFFEDYKISNNKILIKWTDEMISDELLMTLDENLKLEVMQYFKAIYKILNQEENMKEELINVHLIGKFKQTKRGQQIYNTEQKNRILYIVIELLKSNIQKPNQAAKDQITNIDTIQAVLEHFFQLNEEAEFKELTNLVCEFIQTTDVIDFQQAFVPLFQKTQKIPSGQIVQPIVQLFIKNEDITFLRSLDVKICEQIKINLLSENFKSALNAQNILVMASYFCQKSKKFNEQDSLDVLFSNDSIQNYLMNSQSYLNTLQFIQNRKEITIYDTQNHMIVIEALIKRHFSSAPLKPEQISCLINTLCEYLLNQECIFREKFVLTCIQNLQDLDSQFTVPFFKTMFEKITEVSQRQKVVLSDDQVQFQPNLNIGRKIELVMKMLYGFNTQTKYVRNTILEKSEFFFLLRTICHPYVSHESKDLMKIVNTLSKILDQQAEGNSQNQEFTLFKYFEKYNDEIIQYALVQRTGILSPNHTLREIGKNILICLGWQGYLSNFIEQLVVILNYKPLEIASKIKDLLQKEASSINQYDMMFYAEMSKDLMNIFNEKDEEIKKNEIQTSIVNQIQIEQPIQQVVNQKEEKKVVDTGKQLTPAQVQAAMMKKMQEAANSKKKPAAKGAKDTKPQKAAQIQSKQKDEPEEEQVIDKQAKKKMDLDQIVKFCEIIQEQKAQQVQIVWQILRVVNQMKEVNILNYQDITLKHVTMPAIRLLNYSATRFSTYYFLESLFMDNRHTPFFGIRVQLLGCILCIQENRIYHKTIYDFQKFFDHVRQTADFSDMDVGYLQFILMFANFVLKNLDVNLSVKESALNVAQEILETNPKVRNMDLVRLTINMMKSNYIGKSLPHYLGKLIKKLTREELAVMIQSLFDFDPVARLHLLNEILSSNEALFCPVWFSTQMWILQFDDEFYSVSRKIWNKFGLALRTGILELEHEKQFNNIYHHLRNSNTAVFDMTVKAAVAAIEILQGKYDSIVDDLLKFYHTEIIIVRQLNLEALQKTGDDNNFEGNKRFNRIALPLIVQLTSKFISNNSVQKLLDFFIITGSLDQDQAISNKCLVAADAIIHARGSDYAGKMLQILERFIEQADQFKDESVHHAIILIGTLSDYLDKGGQKKLIQTFEKMIQLLMRSKSKGASELVNQSLCKCIPKLSRFFEDRTLQIFNQQFDIIRAGTNESEIRGASYACAGIIKGFGLKFFKEKDIFALIQKDCFNGKKIDPIRLQAGLQFYECLSYSHGKSFEPYVKEILQNILNCIASPNESVRMCANAANKQIVQNFSNLAIKQIVPMFLKGMETDNWRGKFAAVEAVGNMAYCAPKQILGFLPDIVKALRIVLNDTHEKVHEAALQAISKIGSVIKCPEVAELLEVIIKALGNSNLYLNDCLNALLQTSFVHAIDAPSLSLLIPLLDIGLSMHDNNSKQMASQLVGNICSLTQDPEDLLPYMKILIPAIKNSLFDSIPEIRASAAKALGKLSKGLGLVNSIELIEWLNQNLNKKDLAASERSGAAQGLSEVVSSHGENFFSNQVKEIILQARSKDIHLRESYRTVMAYLPTSYDNFVTFLRPMLPIMIEGLADESEEVRRVSMRNVKICIQQYGKKASEMICEPILAMMFDKDSRVRMSSSILMYQQVKEMENDIIKIQPKYISVQLKYRILSGMFIQRYDPIEKVMTQAAQIWKSLIDAPVHILKMIIETLIKMVFDNIQSNHEELIEGGLACMRGLVSRFGERIVNESLDIFEGYLEQATDLKQTSGITRVILNMAEAASHRLLLVIKSRLISIADPFLIFDQKEIRELASQVFITLFKRIGDPQYTESIIESSFLQKLNLLMIKTQSMTEQENEKVQKDISNLILTVKYMLVNAPEIHLQEKIMQLCQIPTHSLKNPITASQAVILRAIAPQVAPLVFSKKYFNTLFTALIEELTNDPIDPANNDQDRLQQVLMCFAEIVAHIPDHEYNLINEQIVDFYDKCVKRNTISYYVDLIQYYCKHTTQNYEKHAPQYTQNVLMHMNSPQKNLVEKVVSCITSIFDKLPKEIQWALVPLIREAIEDVAVEKVDDYLGENSFRRKVNSIKMLEIQEGVKTLATVIQNSIMHGSINVRIDSAYCFKYLIDFASPAAIKTEVIKICGALIRVVNDKFTSELKIQIFHSLRLMLVKFSAMVKAMIAQLQTTFLKSFGDQMSNENVRNIVVENLILLVRMTPKADPIVKDLITQLDGDKIDNEQKIQVAIALALILREKGKTIQESISKQAYSVLSSIIEERKQYVNDKIIVNSAIALGFLSAYSSDPQQMKDLFYAYDNEKDFRVSLGIKLSIIMNGSSNIPDEQKLHADFNEYLKQILNSQSGVIEIDGKDISKTRPTDEEIFRFDGSLDCLVYILDIYQRRFYQSNSPISNAIFSAINQAKIMSKVNEEEDYSMMSKIYGQILKFIEYLPIPSLENKNEKLSGELGKLMKECFQFIHKFYLDFESKRDGRQALLNLLQLTYNNTYDLGVSVSAEEVQPLTKSYIRDYVCEKEQLQGVIPNDMKMICNDIIFAK